MFNLIFLARSEDIFVCLDTTDELSSCKNDTYTTISTIDELYQISEQKSQHLNMIVYNYDINKVSINLSRLNTDILRIQGNDSKIKFTNVEHSSINHLELHSLTIDCDSCTINLPQGATIRNVSFLSDVEIQADYDFETDYYTMTSIRNITTRTIEIFDDFEIIPQKQLKRTIVGIKSSASIHVSNSSMMSQINNTQFIIQSINNNFEAYFHISKQAQLIYDVYGPNAYLDMQIISNSLTTQAIKVSKHATCKFAENSLKLSSMLDVDDGTVILESPRYGSRIYFESSVNATLISSKTDIYVLQFINANVLFNCPKDFVISPHITNFHQNSTISSREGLMFHTSEATFNGKNIKICENIDFKVGTNIKSFQSNPVLYNIKTMPYTTFSLLLDFETNDTAFHFKKPIEIYPWDITMKYFEERLPSDDIINKNINKSFFALCAPNNICQDHKFTINSDKNGLQFSGLCQKVDDEYCIGGSYSQNQKLVDLSICYGSNESLCPKRSYSYFFTYLNSSKIANYFTKSTKNFTIYLLEKLTTNMYFINSGSMPINFIVYSCTNSNIELLLNENSQDMQKFEKLYLQNIKLTIRPIHSKENYSFADVILRQGASIGFDHGANPLIVNFTKLKFFDCDFQSYLKQKNFNDLVLRCQLSSPHPYVFKVELKSLKINQSIISLDKIENTEFYYINRVDHQTLSFSVALGTIESPRINFIGNYSIVKLEFDDSFENYAAVNLFRFNNFQRIDLYSKSTNIPAAFINIKRLSFVNILNEAHLNSIYISDNIYLNVNKNPTKESRIFIHNTKIVGVAYIKSEIDQVTQVAFCNVDTSELDKFIAINIKMEGYMELTPNAAVSFHKCDITDLVISTQSLGSKIASINLKSVEEMETRPPEAIYMSIDPENIDKTTEWVVVNTVTKSLAEMWEKVVIIEQKEIFIDGQKYFPKVVSTTDLVKVVLIAASNMKNMIGIIAGSVVGGITIFLGVLLFIIKFKERKLLKNHFDTSLLFEVN